MKKLLSLVFLLLILVSATEFTPSELETSSFHTIEGTWELVSFHHYDDGVNISSTEPKAKDYRQVKMYYNGKVMWSRYAPSQTNGRFGYGNYFITEDELHETIVYGDNEMMKALDTLTEFVFELELQNNTYSQINLDEEGNRTFSENYVRID